MDMENLENGVYNCLFVCLFEMEEMLENRLVEMIGEQSRMAICAWGLILNLIWK